MHTAILTATKEYSWDMAHLLSNHEGLCLNLHGHTYKMLVSVAGRTSLVDKREGSPTEGMVVDFKELKEVVNDIIVKKLDHAVVINQNTTDEFERKLGLLASECARKVVFVDYRVTAENMALDFFTQLNDVLQLREASYYVSSIRLYETPTSYAEVSM